ncbi:putative insecticidal toxin complex protein [Pseudomonas sp. CFII64]|uniref:RHS repeat domain-containing protein n=1 Tax=Pseudomonas sp. CFII64 TaxID=911242 RepID=UPI000357558D|nr:RHS repeat-associated core domain-containing protein [Pseudomonas sp. CFII64]EPJ75501.1 putative insecticidal toxin complex protein [Pseudomonas sp. CFII64]
MNVQSAALHHDTPLLTTIDPRGLTVRSVAWCRTLPADSAEARITRSAFNAAGRLVSSWDPRLCADQAPANLSNIYSLGGAVLCSDSVDAGWRVSLPGEAGELSAGWDGRDTAQRLEYDVLLRPTAIFENDRCVERLHYGDADAAVHNQCGQLIRHDDPAGTRLNSAFGLTGAVLAQAQHFLAELVDPDWPEPEAERDALLEAGAGAITRWTYNPLGEALKQTDALGNAQAFAHTVAGQLKAVSMQLKDQPEEVLVSDIRYNAQDRVESEAAGNGVTTTARYREEDGRLIELNATRSNGAPLQDLLYDYDPVGNVLRIEDRAQPTRYFANQRIESVSNYQYDTLYQLIEATGREAATVNHGPVFPEFQSPADPSQLANYTQTYRYDAGGNLQQLTHVGAQTHSRTLVTARTSNRSLPVINDQPPDEATIGAGFDANGNLLQLQAGQTLSWDRRNQLQQVHPVLRETADDDSERYIYDASGQRLRKVRMTQAKAVSHRAEVRYLPGLEIRTDTATGEILQVICVQVGRNSVRVLHWQAGKPDDLANDQYRYTLNDHLGSGTIELDNVAQIISQESYYPFGGTSWWAGRNAIEASYKTVRYSGKERDATGLYYYGLRYYAPWLQRWINPDPAGVVDGLNVYRMVRNSPLRFGDWEGAAPYDVLGEQEMSVRQNYGLKNVARGFSSFSSEQKTIFKQSVKAALKLLAGTNKELSKEKFGQGVSESFSATFGQVSQELELQIVDDLKGSFDRQREYLKSLVSGGGFKISLFETHSDVEGIAFKRSAYAPERVVGISVNALENYHVLDLARVLIHESSHAVEDTVDVYYNVSGTLSKLARGDEIGDWSRDFRRSLHAISMQGLNSVAVNEGHLSNIFAEVSERSIAPGQLRSEFLTNEFFRAKVLLRNADTYAAFVSSTRLPARFISKLNKKTASAPGFHAGKETF